MTAALLYGCSGETDREADSAKSLEDRSAAIGREAGQTFREPMEDARNAVDLENERMRQYEKSLAE